MNSFSYRIYYEHKPSKLKPLESPKSRDQVIDALTLFWSQLPHFIPDDAASITRSKLPNDPTKLDVRIETVLDERDTTAAIVRCLDDFALLAEKI